jgi:AcrR family transcriptional regulator
MAKPRPSSRLSFERREKIILDAAAALFAARGFDGTTTKAISNLAKVNEALLFRHYPNKRSLYEALLRRKVSRLFHNVIPVLEKTLEQPLAEGLFKIAKTFIGEHRRDPQIFRMMLFSALEHHRLSGIFFKGRLPFAEFLERFVRERMEKGEIQRQDPLIMSRAFLGLIQNYTLMTQVFKAKKLFPKSEDETLRAYAQLFARGIRA